MANQSADARSAVIQVLINVVDDEVNREEALLSTKWTASVEVLGELQALEAIDALVKYLTASGLALTIEPHPRPAKDALLKIGKPAIPRLIQALSTEGAIRYEAIDTLAEIEPVAVPQLIEALANANPYIRGGAAVALGMIGGQAAKDAINQALKKETNSKAEADFKYALDYIHRYKEFEKSR